MLEGIHAGLSTPSPGSFAPIPVPGRDVLTDILRGGAQRLVGQAIEAEVGEWVARHADLRNERGHQLVVVAALTCWARL